MPGVKTIRAGNDPVLSLYTCLPAQHCQGMDSTPQKDGVGHVPALHCTAWNRREGTVSTWEGARHNHQGAKGSRAPEGRI